MPPRPSTVHPQNDAAAYRDVLLFEERLKSNALSLQRRKSRYQPVAFLLVEVLFLPPEESLLVIPYKLLLQQLLPHIYTPDTKVLLPPYIASGLLFVAITTLLLFFASGMYTEKIAYANRYLPHANRALRSFNMYLNVRKPPLRSKFKFLDKPLSFLFPRQEHERSQSKAGIPATSPRSMSPPASIARSSSPSAARPIPAIPPATNPRGELIFSSRVDRNFREGYERYRSAFEKMREEREQRLKRQNWTGWMTQWWDATPTPSGASTPVRTLSSSSAQRGRLSSSRSNTPVTIPIAHSPRQRSPSSGLVKQTLTSEPEV
ncbi:hypothetical protein M378DRAFT_14786 [Amanita muscaria Koide BX008]|uniref:Transmembrane protein 188 n=1 Tax=Amanita muscaria (strain Koide BX008) TaxID=946122 RepID=A0A0C2WDL1_AMAMK|nr:hypothetical protein M378DRAFT_14786 [Amanita muscaria Koide BX008]